MNLERRIKRQFIARDHECLAVVLPGFEAVCRRELEALGGTISITGRISGGILFKSRFIDIQRANLHLRSAVRILMRLHQTSAADFNRLEKQTDQIPWYLYLPSGTVPAIKVTSRRSRLFHTGAVAQRMAAQIHRFWEKLEIAPQVSDQQTLYVRLEHDKLLVSLDSSGTALYQRGLKAHPSRAPLRETTAAAILSLCGFRPDRPLADPMCGAGTFALEAAMKLKGMAPGRRRTFAFMQWPAFRSQQWEHLLAKADRAVQCIDKPMILAADIDARACRHLESAAVRYGLDDAVAVRCMDFLDPQAPAYPAPPGLVMLNPPYGRRLETPRDLKHFYRKIGTVLLEKFRRWRVALIVPDRKLIDVLPFQLSTKMFMHGGLKVVLVHGRIK